MSAVILPQGQSYFAIYTLECERGAKNTPVHGLNWDLHATSKDKESAISHARLLALQPGVSEVHVKQVRQNIRNGIVQVRDIMRCKRSPYARALPWVAGAALLGVLAGVVQWLLNAG